MGDYVKVDEAIASIETEKVTIEIKSSKSGKLVKLMCEVNQTVAVGDALFEIDTDDQGSSNAPSSNTTKSEPKASEQPKPTKSKEESKSSKQADDQIKPQASKQEKEEIKSKQKPSPVKSPLNPKSNYWEEEVTHVRQFTIDSLHDISSVNAILTTFNEVIPLI